MADLISREAIKAKFCGKRWHYLRNQINKFPSVDAVKVVRCKDCLFKQSPKQYGDLQCKILDVPMKNDDFCSYGERKEDNATSQT